MIYLYGYLVIAATFALIMATVVIRNLHEKARRGHFQALAITEEASNGASIVTEKLFDEYLVSVLVALVLGVLWPISLVLKGLDLWETRRNRENEKYPVKKSWLTELVNIEDVEVEETVRDPMHAAPALPFGFLNPQWREFRENLGKKGKLWRFVVPDKHTGVGVNLKLGYVIVRRGKPSIYFVTQYR